MVGATVVDVPLVCVVDGANVLFDEEGTGVVDKKVLFFAL